MKARNESNFMFYGKTFELHEQEHQQDRLWHYKIVANGEKINRFRFLFTFKQKLYFGTIDKPNPWAVTTATVKISQIIFHKFNVLNRREREMFTEKGNI